MRGLLVGALLGGPSALGCAPAIRFTPLVAHQDGKVRVEASDVVLRAEVKPGLHHVPPSITPIRIAIENTSSQGIRVDLEDIRLESSGGSFPAIPVGEIEPRRPVGLSLDPASPYASAQGAAPYYLGAQRYGGFAVDPALPYTSAGGWSPYARRELELSAFVDGFIDIGESRRGLVYFRTPPEDTGRLTLEVQVHVASGSGQVTLLEIPYFVEG